MSKILLIENDSSIVDAISHSLSAQGAEITTSGDGAEGVQLVRDGEFDLIILSVELPRVSGYSVCNKLKKDPALASIPLILTSSEATPETFVQHKKLKTRAEGYLHKPIDMGELRAAAGEFISLTAIDDDDGPMETVVMDVEGLEVDLDDMDITSSEEVSLEEVSLEEDIAALDLPVLPDDGNDLLDDDVLGSLEVLDAMESGVGLEIEETDEPIIDGDDDLEIELSSDEEDTDEEPEAEPTGDKASAAPAPNPSASYVSDGLLDTMRSEINELRHKVRGLEETIEAKELEFSERLLQESTRARQAIGDRQKVAQLEHAMEKARSSMAAAEAKAKETASQIGSLEESLQARKVGQDELSGTIDRLKKELADSKTSQDDSQSRVSELESKLGKLSQELLEGNQQRNQAREIISSMMQVLDDLNRHPNSAD